MDVSSHRLADRHPIQSSGLKTEKISPETSWSFQFCGWVAVRKWSAHGGISWDTFCELMCWENRGLTIVFSSSVVLVSYWDLSVCCMAWPCSTKPPEGLLDLTPCVCLWGEDQVLKILFEHLTASINEEGLDNGIILNPFMFGFFFLPQKEPVGSFYIILYICIPLVRLWRVGSSDIFLRAIH